MDEGLLDTNVFLHAQAHDAHTEVCRRLLHAIAAGDRAAWIDPMVLHELTYVLPRYVKGMPRCAVSLYVRTVLSWPGIRMEDKPFWTSVLDTWDGDPQLNWTDAVLVERSRQTGGGIWTQNVRDFERHGFPRFGGRDAVAPTPLTLPSHPIAYIAERQPVLPVGTRTP